MKLTQTILVALTAFKLAQAIPQNGFGGFGGNNNNDQNNNNNNNQNNNNNNGQDTGAANGTDTGAANGQGNGAGNGADTGNGGNGGNGGNAAVLLDDNIQAASNSVGEPDAAAGQSDSITWVTTLCWVSFLIISVIRPISSISALARPRPMVSKSKVDHVMASVRLSLNSHHYLQANKFEQLWVTFLVPTT